MYRMLILGLIIAPKMVNVLVLYWVQLQHHFYAYKHVHTGGLGRTSG